MDEELIFIVCQSSQIVHVVYLPKSTGKKTQKRIKNWFTALHPDNHNNINH